MGLRGEGAAFACATQALSRVSSSGSEPEPSTASWKVHTSKRGPSRATPPRRAPRLGGPAGRGTGPVGMVER